MPELTEIAVEKTPIQELLLESARNHAAYAAAAVIGYDHNGEVTYLSSEMSRAELLALLLDTLAAVQSA